MQFRRSELVMPDRGSNARVASDRADVLELLIPESIREERIREKGRHERSISGWRSREPLGRYRLPMSLPLDAIHGTHMPWPGTAETRRVPGSLERKRPQKAGNCATDLPPATR